MDGLRFTVQRSVDLRSNGLLDGLRFVSLMFGWFTVWIIEDLGFRVEGRGCLDGSRFEWLRVSLVYVWTKTM